MRIVVDDLSGEEIKDFLEEHLSDMRRTSPPESVHALDLTGLKQPNVTFWSVYQEKDLIACGALKQLCASHGEIKSMRTSASSRGKGVASHLLKYILQTAQNSGYQKISLETGSMEFFKPARLLYSKFGFETCPPFADYKEDPNSVFMTRDLQ